MTKKADTNVFVIYYKNAVVFKRCFLLLRYLLGNHDATDSQKQKFSSLKGIWLRYLHTATK